MTDSVAIVTQLLHNMSSPSTVNSLVSPSATYTSLNHDNPDLKRIMPHCGISTGPEGFTRVFTSVGKLWEMKDFTIETIFGSGENVAAFGVMTLRSYSLDITKTTPFAIWCVVRDGKVVSMQVTEDTFASAATFRSGGEWKFDTGDGEFSI